MNCSMLNFYGIVYNIQQQQIYVFTARKTYVDLLNENPRHAMSQYDMDISQKVEQMVLAEPTFSDLKGSVGIYDFAQCFLC